MTKTTGFQVGVKVRLFNFTLDQAMRAKGWSRQEAADALGVHLQTLYRYMGFRGYPAADVRMRFAVILEVPEDILFPTGLEGFRITRQSEAIPLTAADMTELSHLEDPSGDSDPMSLRAIRMALATLKPQERIVMERRFGLSGDAPMTHREIGEEIGVGGARIGQIEAQALRKLRHPVRSVVLTGMVETSLKDSFYINCSTCGRLGDAGATYQEAAKWWRRRMIIHEKWLRDRGEFPCGSGRIQIRHSDTGNRWVDGAPVPDSWQELSHRGW